MNNQATEKGVKMITIPEGCFCSGSRNCSDCVYWESSKRDSNDRGYCNHYGSYYHPSERQGCLSYESR